MAQAASTHIRPEAIDKLPFLTDDKKAQYKSGLTQLWIKFNSNPEGSPAWVDADQKIRNASAKLYKDLADFSSHRSKQQAASQGHGGAGGGGGQQPQQQQQQQQQQRPPTQNGQQGVSQQQRAPGGGAPSINNLSQGAREELQKVKINVPHTYLPEHVDKYKQSWYSSAVNLMYKKDVAISKGKSAQQQITLSQQAGQGEPPQWKQVREEAIKEVHEANQRWLRFKADNEQKGKVNEAARNGQMQAPAGQTANLPQAPDMQRVGSGGQQAIKVESRNSTSPSLPQGSFPQPVQQNMNPSGPAHATPVNMAQQPTQPQSQPHPQQQQIQRPPQSATQPQMPPQNYQAQQQYQNAQQQRQMAQPPNPQQQTMQQHHQQVQQQAMQNAPQRPQVPHALSHDDAVAQAQASYAQARQIPPQPQSNAPQAPNGLPFNANSSHAMPTSAYPTQAQGHTQVQAPGQHGPNLHNAQPNPNNKFPIAKQIQVDPRLNQPMSIPAARPTMSQAGMQNQPGLARPPPYTLEGEGDHVLSKSKLSELVRQVTGGGGGSTNTIVDRDPTASSTSTSTSATSAAAAAAIGTSISTPLLDPAVEENLLAYADDFVDDLITSACKLAKLRPERMLDIRDLQIVLERNYGIRIPGFALEEVRTVRKFVPAPGWQGKMQAISTAKTLGGVGGAGKVDS
ncbi:hypothetical protein LTR62_006614 [Meristemomyces frigidus]|uniref:Transcription initiation factor TFIID subunit 12 domain-containing protein n=1 Tax=Meristemomyces frigidus TaxID=1508187 RepID=A0AAN7TVE1_9PEZI|nr:hypothetical protein LTR62_006614 [Meristemomyces frigidus]